MSSNTAENSKDDPNFSSLPRSESTVSSFGHRKEDPEPRPQVAPDGGRKADPPLVEQGPLLAPVDSRKASLQLSEPQGSGDGRKVSLLGAHSSTDLAQVDTQMVSEVKRQLQEDSTTITERIVEGCGKAGGRSNR